jgi:hypothetical protein
MMNQANGFKGKKTAVVFAMGIFLGLPAISHADVGCLPPDVVRANAVKPDNVVQGTTPEQIKARFASVIEGNFANGAAENIIRHLSDRELTDLAARYNENTEAARRPLLAIFATRLTDQSLVRVASAFGKSAVTNAVNTYSSAEMKAAALPQIASLPTKIQPMTAPTTDMTINEIYLEFRTAPVGSVGPASALSETAMFAASRISVAAWAGYAIGTQISNAIETYDPSLSDAIGGTVAGMVNQVQNAGSDIKEGQVEKALDDLFGNPVWNSGDYSGDYDVSYPMFDFEQAAGGGDHCGENGSH